MKSLSSTLLLFCLVTLRLAGAAEKSPTSDIGYFETGNRPIHDGPV
jgi:hypothetical protein